MSLGRRVGEGFAAECVRPSNPQLSAQTPVAECAGKVESVTIGSINKEKSYHIFVYLFLFYVLLGTNYKFTIYLLRELI